MKSVTSRQFREMYAALPLDVRRHARRAYALFREDASHPGLRFKKIDHTGNVYSVRVGPGYRALGRVDRDVIVWFRIGSHKEYDRLV